MVIPTRRQENGTITVSLGHFKPKYARVKPKCPSQVSNFQVNVSNSYLRVDGGWSCYGIVLGKSHNWTPRREDIIGSVPDAHHQPLLIALWQADANRSTPVPPQRSPCRSRI